MVASEGSDPMFDDAMWDALRSRLLLFVPTLITSAVMFLVFWLAAVAAQRIIDRVGVGRGINPDLLYFLGRAAKISLLAFGAITALGTLGIDVSALVAGLGLTGFALGFALKDIISNALSGMLVIIYKPFKRGDQISVTGLDGTVVEINLRYTVLRTDDQLIFVPNANLFTNPVKVRQATVP